MFSRKIKLIKVYGWIYTIRYFYKILLLIAFRFFRIKYIDWFFYKKYLNSVLKDYYYIQMSSKKIDQKNNKNLKKEKKIKNLEMQLK